MGTDVPVVPMGNRPISEYCAIGNDDRIALVDDDGSVDWCCFPHLASPSVFCRLLDTERGGHFAVRPTAHSERHSRYLDGTNVLLTSFETASGVATLTDFMPVSRHGGGPASEQRALFRQFRCDEGRVTVEVECKPRPGYGRVTPTLDRRDGYIHVSTPDESFALQARGPIELDIYGDRAVGYATIEAGTSIWLCFQYDHYQSIDAPEAREIQEETVGYWRDWSADLVDTVDELTGGREWDEAVLRSALMLKLLINEGSGAIYAAATTSLPEAYGGERNWDYRYNWIRDAKFTVQALFSLGKTEEAFDYFEWFRRIAHTAPGKMQPVYGVHGERELTEETLDHLVGYRYASPVRIGNAASDQRQLDIYGAIVQGLYETILHDGELSEDDWHSIRRIADHVCEVWDEKDAGMWEYRAEPRHYVHSKLMCWVAIDRTIQLAQGCDLAVPDRWDEARESMREAIETRGYSEELGSFTQTFEDEKTLDATALLIPIYEFLPSEDRRVQRTLDTVIERLMAPGGLVYRAKGPAVPDEGRGAFLLCSFWLVDALALCDRYESAREIFSNVLSHIQEPSLLPERIDTGTGEYLGNFPQAFSHIGLINSAIYLGVADRGQQLPGDPENVTPIFQT